MNRRILLAAVPVLLLAGRAALAQVPYALTDRDRADVARLEAYLDGVKTLKAQFLQVASDGQISRGTAWLARPGRMRFQYDPPSPLLLVAGHGLVVFHDSQLEQTSNIPIGQTPLGLLLRDRISLSGEVTVTDFRRQPGQIEVTVLHTASPGDGSLTLNFTDDPLTLRGWTVIDAQRRSTRVSLYNIQTGVSVDPKLFEFVDPRFFQNNQGH
ncbi:MAG TPA: outer-membrane lipoprotein carrier protein LolA [Acidisphaera sp.]|nr:outer-membrane lipoprotein carrier protein LolA [Acidisphaera sp.]